jgi:crotonobetainyl-CoA:carnitine CoA-transferase CaiB-like acyl-CoA transferase
VPNRGPTPSEHSAPAGESRGEAQLWESSLAAQRWAESGLAWLTGFAERAPVIPTAALPLAADASLVQLAESAPAGAYSGLRGAELLAERAACYGYARRGRTAPGGACRLLAARGGWLAANLPRADDARALAAWLEDDAALAELAGPLDEAAWALLAARVRVHDRDACVARARLLGLAVAPSDAPPREGPRGWLRIAARGPSAGPRPAAAPRVVELASLWAGPLAGRLLRLAGADVVKVESTRRPDGARAGDAAFFARLNGGKRSVALDFASEGDRRRLAALLEHADVVIEGSRPRALAQLGVSAERWVGARSGRVWLSLTGYGRAEPQAEWVAFGDDAAAAAGLCWCVPEGAPLFVGDAIADPLAGLHGALAALRAWRSGEGALLDVALTRVVAASLGACAPVSAPTAAIVPPRLRGSAPEPARALGADTAAVLRALGID